MSSKKFLSINTCSASKKAFRNSVDYAYEAYCCTCLLSSLACWSYESEPFAVLFLHKCIDAVEMHIPLRSNFLYIASCPIPFPLLLSLNFMALHPESGGIQSETRTGQGASWSPVLMLDLKWGTCRF